jgi:hypothetical protein
MLTRKQQIYYDILDMMLPAMRNVQRQSSWRRFGYGSFYPELELVHNVHRLLLVPGFTEHDVHWLNSQARIFFERGNNRAHALHEPITSCIAELFTMVPEPLKKKLSWQGPDKTGA